ncbi:MAG: tetratricopeptide repeat protein [Bacteroidia bacterium]|nr:tetratricopeptide repeat protein [Bacteroidia bacterium]
MTRLLKITLLLFMPFMAFCQVNKNFEKAYDLHMKDQPAKAEKYILKALKQDKGNPDYMVLCSQIYLAQFKTEQAKTILDLGIASNPKSVLFLSSRANTSYLLGENEDAIKFYSSALRYETVDSSKGSMYCNRASAKMAIRKFESAKKDLIKSLKIDTNSFCANNNMGIVGKYLGDDSLAEASLFNVVRIAPEDHIGYANLGYFYSERERYEEAISMLNKCLEIDPKFAYGYNNRAFVHLQTGNIIDARKDVLKSLELNPYNSYAYRNLGLIMLEDGDTTNACKAWNTAIELGFTKQYGSAVQRLIDENCSSEE